MPTDYSKGKIYKIISPSTGLTYYGSTVESLSRRMSKHRSKFKTDKGNKAAFKVLSCDDAKIFLVEKYPCNDVEELRAREGWYQQNFECVNGRIAGRTIKQWRQDNKQVIAKRQKQYKEDNKEAIAKYQKQYYGDNKQALSKYKKQYRQENREALAKKNKQYRRENREALAKQKKQYRQENKEALNSKQRAKFMCECGAVVSRIHMLRHVREAKIHQQYMFNPFAHM